MFVILKRVGSLHDYDVRALDMYAGSGHYLSLREAGMPQAQAAQVICEMHGHDAPRGLCLRCGLGTDFAADRERERERGRKRLAERDRWLSGR